MRLPATLSFAALFAAAAPAAEPPDLTATFIGNMAVHLTDGTNSLVSDFPYESGAFGYMHWTPDLVPGGSKPLCLITHAHRDHYAPELAANHCGSLLGPADVTKGFAGEVVPMRASVSHAGMTIRPIPTPHADLEHASYRVSWHGLELYFTGDTEDPSALLAERDLHAAFVSPWLLDAVHARGERVQARAVIVYHHTVGQTVTYPGARMPVQGERWSIGAAVPRPTASARVAALAEEVWQHQLAESTYLQVKHGRLPTQFPALTPDQAAEDVAYARGVLAKIEALAAQGLPHEDALTLAVLRWQAETAIAAEPYYWLQFPITPYMGGFMLSFEHQALAAHPFEEPRHVTNYLKLLDDYADQLGQLRAHVVGQVERGIRLPKPALPGVVGLFRALRERADAALGVSSGRLNGLPEHDRARLTDGVRERLETRVRPGFDALLAGLDSEAYLAAAPDAVGLAQYPQGEAFYRHLVRAHTTLDVSPEELHALGEKRVAELEAELADIRTELGFTGSRAEFEERLRRDPRFLAKEPADVEARFQEYLARIEPRVAEVFARTPRAAYGVARLDPAAEAGMTFGYYQPSNPRQPRGLYYYNGSQLDQRSLIFAGPLIYHELVPGHHFHLALQNENEALPMLRRELSVGAFNEGWGNYAAKLAREMRMLDDPYDRYAWGIFDMFISVRLVVDTGMNLQGWSLDKARTYMREHLFQSDAEIASESLRYSTDMPGQALAYKAGLEKLLELRERAGKLAGDAFDLRDFHEAVLGSGALPLSLLERHVEWCFGADRAEGPCPR